MISPKEISKMKVRTFFIITITIILSTQVACTPPKADKLETLSVTIDPQKYFLKSIVGNKFEVNCVVPAGANPESFDVAPSQMITLSKSIAYFKVGYLGIENNLIEKVKKNNPDTQFIDCSNGIDSLESDHSHENCDHHHGGHDGGDPHIWSSPGTARIIAQNMYNAVIKLDPSNKDFYRTNYDSLLVEFNDTDSIIKSYINKAQSKSFVIYHPALSYFANEYGLEQLTIEHEGKNPSPLQLKQLIDEAKSKKVNVVFIQQEYDTKNAEIIAEAIGAKMVTINLLSYYWKQELTKIASAFSTGE